MVPDGGDPVDEMAELMEGVLKKIKAAWIAATREWDIDIGRSGLCSFFGYSRAECRRMGAARRGLHLRRCVELC